MFPKLFNYYYSGKNWYHAFSNNIELVSTKIKNKKLSHDLESECIKQGGVLTYAEYLQIEQFGENGYYAHSKHKGSTAVHVRWGKALAMLCKEYNYDTVIEFGCGNGNLGIEIVKEFNKLSKGNLKWIGIEIIKEQQKEIIKKFINNKLLDNLGGIFYSLKELQIKKKSLIIFPYSLDNIPPEIFLNTTATISYPNALLGLTIKNDILQEVIIPEEILKKKKIFLKDGLFRKGNGHTFDITSWRLRKGQRMYLSPDAYTVVYDYANQMHKDSIVLVIDEFRNRPFQFEMGFLGTPKDLDHHSLECKNSKKYYKNAGKWNLYYPMYFDTFYKFLHAIGFQHIFSDIEQRFAAEICGHTWINIKYRKFFTHAFLFSKKSNKKSSSLPLLLYTKKIF